MTPEGGTTTLDPGGVGRTPWMIQPTMRKAGELIVKMKPPSGDSPSDMIEQGNPFWDSQLRLMILSIGMTIPGCRAEREYRGAGPV